MKTLINLLASFALLLTVSLYSQPTQQEWVSRYSGIITDEAKMVKADNSGNVYVTGKSVGSGTGYDFLTVKYNSAGAQQWEARYNGPSNSTDEAVSVAVDNSGNVYTAGWSIGTATMADFCLVKYNSSGTQQWVARYNDSLYNNDDAPIVMLLTDSGNVYLGGYSSYSSGHARWTLLKFNSSGVRQWVKQGPQNNWEQIADLKVDASENIYAAQMGWSPAYQVSTTVMKKLNGGGTELWNWYSINTYLVNMIPMSLAIDASGNTYFCTRKLVSGQNYNFSTVKLNSSGGFVWQTEFNGSANDTDYPRKVIVGPTNDIYVAGFSKSTSGGKDLTLIMYNQSGVQQWVSHYNGSSNGSDEGFDMVVDVFGNAYVTGYTDTAGTQNYITVKYNYSGSRIWAFHYNGPGNGSDVASSVFIENNHSVYVTGASSNGSNNDYATIKYSQLVGINPVSNELPEKFSLAQNYPNPFNPNTVIRFSLPAAGMTSLKVYDILGLEVATIVNEQLKPGTYEVDFDGSRYSSGIYFYKLNVIMNGAEAFSETKKMLMIK